ncbi:MAG TPA: hypothetical protein VNT32_15460, partial [Thermoleophilaceae bacterium]|nr:hypothetical protein [Thermoleophilaceae bacterium]
KDIDRAIFAYNHADWYVDSVNLRAKLIAGVPAEVIGSLTGLTEGRFPVSARARYGESSRSGIEIRAREGSPAVAVNDGIVRRIGESERLGRYLVLEDSYGNRYTYGGLGEIARSHPVPRDQAGSKLSTRAPRANRDPKPDAPASAGAQAPPSEDAPAPVKRRLFANPARPAAREAGGEGQLDPGEIRTFRAYFSRPYRLRASDVRLVRLEKGSRVIAGTILGRTGRPDTERDPHLRFEIRPAGRRSPRIDPRPILDGWRLLEASAVHRGSRRNALRQSELSIGQVVLLPKHLLERRVLADDRIEIYPCGRRDIRAGRIDRRVLATLAYLAESGLRPTVSSLICGHGRLTASGHLSHHVPGAAVDISAINGVPILGHQERGGITDQAVSRLLALQGTLAPAQIISLIDRGGPTLSLADHADHIHVGFRPRGGRTAAVSALSPGDWHDLVDRLASIENPVIPIRR